MGQEGPLSHPGTREVGDLGTGPQIVSGGTQPAHLTPPPFAHSPTADPWNQGRTRIFSLFPLAGQASKRLAPQSEKKGVGSVCFSLSSIFFFLRLISLLGEKSINLNQFFVCDEGKKSRVGGEQQISPPGPHQEMHFTGDVVCDTRGSERGCHVDRTSQLPRFLSLLHRKKRDAANLFTFPKCQDKLGGLHVGAQSWRQLFYEKSVWGWTFPFASSVLARRQDGGPHLPGRVRLASPPRGGRAARARMDARPDRPTLRTHGGRRGGGRGRERGLRTQAPAAARPRARRRARAPGWEPLGQDSHLGGSGGATGRRAARFPSRNAHQNFCVFLPPLLKSKSYNL